MVSNGLLIAPFYIYYMVNLTSPLLVVLHLVSRFFQHFIIFLVDILIHISGYFLKTNSRKRNCDILVLLKVIVYQISLPFYEYLSIQTLDLVCTSVPSSY